MVNPFLSSFRKTLKLFIQYMAVAYAAIPASILYTALIGLGVNQKAAFTVALCVGAGCALLAWRVLDKRIFLPTPVARRDMVTNVAAGANIQLPTLQMNTTAPFLVVCVLGAVYQQAPVVKIVTVSNAARKSATNALGNAANMPTSNTASSYEIVVGGV